MSKYNLESREIELEALERVASYYSDHHKIIDLGDSDKYDFEVHHSEKGLVGIGEVSWLEDPVKKSAWSALFKQDQHHIIPLRVGQGFWSMSLKHSANLRLVSRKLPDLIDEMLNSQQTERQIYETWPPDSISNSLREMGIEYLRKVDGYGSNRDECFFLFEASGGVIPDSLEPLAEFILGLLNNNYQDCLKKLNVDGNLDRHLYFKMGSYLPFNLVDPLGKHNPPVEIGNFNFPNGISHVWLIGSNENFRSVLWHKNSKYLEL